MDYEKIFDESAKRNMIEWNLVLFRGSHPKLLRSILEAMASAVNKSKDKPYQGELRTFHVQLQHDKGIINMTTMAHSYQNAIEQICKAEGCPERAIKKIWT
jgi:hypothetical protein